MKKLSITLAFVMLAGLLLAACGGQQSAAEGYLGTIKQRGTLIVGTSADYPPYESKDDQDNFVGFDMDLIREIGTRMGLKVEIKDMAFDSLIAAVQEKKVDVVIAAMQTSPERLEKVDFSVEYHMQKDAFIIRADAAFTLNAPGDAAGKTIGVQTGTIQEDWVLKNLVPAGTTEDQIFRYERVDQAALDLKAGRIDIVFINADPAAELVKTDPALKLGLVTQETVVGGQAIALPKGEAALKAELDKWIKTLQDEGVIQQIQDKYNIP